MPYSLIQLNFKSDRGKTVLCDDDSEIKVVSKGSIKSSLLKTVVAKRKEFGLDEFLDNPIELNLESINLVFPGHPRETIPVALLIAFATGHIDRKELEEIRRKK